MTHISRQQLPNSMTRNIFRSDQVETFLSSPLLMLVHQLPDLRSVGRGRKLLERLDASAAPTTGSTSPVVGNRRNILDPTNSEPMTSQHSDRCLSTGTRSPSTMTSRGPNTNMERGYSLVLRNLRGGRGCLHGSVWGPLQSISLHMLTPCATRDRLGASQISNVNHGIVEAGVDVGDSPMICRLLRFLRHDLDYPRSKDRERTNLNHLLST
jgi:hypothetical protein